MKQYIVGAIFARGGSKGVMRKNIRLIGGKPLIAYSIEVAKKSRFIDRIIVSTDDIEIANVARKFGAEVPFMRPNELARDDSPEWLAWQHSIATMTSLDAGRMMDILVSIPPTSPLRHVEDVDKCIQTLIESDADIVITGTNASSNPFFNMITLDDKGYAHLVVSDRNMIYRRQDAPKVYDITTVAYAARAAFVLKSKSMFDGKIRAIIIPRERALDIDTELDLKLAEFMISNKKQIKIG